MTRKNDVSLKCLWTDKGIEFGGLCYQSPELRVLRMQAVAWSGGGTEGIRVKSDLLEPERIYVWHPCRPLWLEVPIAEFIRLATQREIEAITRDFYSRKDR